jgi:Cu(I)/Ag(I) efflux system protein CusF
MTMVFRAGKPELLEGVKVGDAVRFRAAMPGGTYTVTSIEVVR